MSLDSLLWTAVGGKDRNGDGGDDDDIVRGSNNEEGLKFLFVGGKGGVGKSTTSSAIATLLATKCAKRVLLVSTDPAHSLSDVFRRTDNEPFGNVPTAPEPERISNLHVMEIDPTDTMKRELAKWADLATAVAGTDTSGSGSAASELATRIHTFQAWLSGIPGIDEATALSAAVRYIESGNYDIIVFDTAPTGHTLKLLQMPDILQVGIERLQSWQGTLWGYYEAIKGFTSGTGGAATARKKTEAKAEISKMLDEYKRGIQKVAQMLQDQHRTRFAVVCIAEYLSVAETRRLMQELRKNRVHASHIIVNQLVVDNALSDEELRELEGLAEVGTLQLNKKLLGKTVHACTLTTARRKIQEKYLNQLKTYPETQDILGGICEAPLLPEEVTGIDALIHFGELLVSQPPELGVAKSSSAEASNTFKRPLYDDELTSEGPDQRNPATGDHIVVVGLAKSKQYNGLQGVVTSDLDTATGRYAIEVEYDGKQKGLALQRQNFLVTKSSSSKRQKVEQKETLASRNAAQDESNSIVTDENISKAKQILSDPEIKAMIDTNPRFAQAVQDVMANPMNFMQYLMDPELSPLISKAMSKLQG